MNELQELARRIEGASTGQNQSGQKWCSWNEHGIDLFEDKECPEACFDLWDRLQKYKDLGGLGPDVAIQLSSWDASDGAIVHIAERLVVNLNDSDYRTHVATGTTRTEAIVKLFIAVMPIVDGSQ